MISKERFFFELGDILNDLIRGTIDIDTELRKIDDHVAIEGLVGDLTGQKETISKLDYLVNSYTIGLNRSLASKTNKDEK